MTRNDRASILGFGLAALLVLPAPDGTVSQPDRQHVAACYSGITPAAQSSTAAAPGGAALVVADALVTELALSERVITTDLVIADALVTTLTIADALREES